MLHRLAALGGIWVVRQTSRTRATNIWAHRRGTYREGASAQQLIAAGYGQVLAERMVALGGSTACVGVAQPNWQLDAAKYVTPVFHLYSFPPSHSCSHECIRFCGIQADYPTSP